MQPIKFVSSFSKEGYKLYGRTFVASALKYLPANAELVIYYEGENPCELRDKRLTFRNLYKIPGVVNWLQALGSFPMFRGETHGKRRYQWDAVRFTRKIFAQCDAAADYDGLLFWVDADVEFFAPLDELWLRSVMEDHFIAYLKRPSWHLCASFVGWNCKHKQSDMFWTRYWMLMMTGEFVILPEWHDSYILAMLIEGLELESLDLAANYEVGDGPVNVFDIVFDGIARHYKGNLKFGPKRYQQLITIVKEMQPASIMEIGTWNGARAIEMAGACTGPLEYVGFDLFEQATPDTDAAEKNVKPHNHIEAVRAKLLAAGVKAVLVGGNTRETLPQWVASNPDKKFDLIYIDGGHAVETIRSDLTNAVKVLAHHGVIIMDDWYADLPEGEIEKFGCNKVLESSGMAYYVLPVADPIVGGGTTQMVVVDPFDDQPHDQ